MSNPVNDLAERRAALSAQCAVQRLQLRQQEQHMQPAMHHVQTMLRLQDLMQQHPWLLLTGAVCLMVTRRFFSTNPAD